MENLQNLLNEFNKTRKFNINTTNFKFVKLKDLENVTDMRLSGYYFINGNFGREVIVINSDNQLLINMPNRYVSMFEKLDTFDEITKNINDGRIFFDVLKTERKGKTFFNVFLKYKDL